MESGNWCGICNKAWPTLDAYNQHLLTYNHWNDINFTFQGNIDQPYSLVQNKRRVLPITTLQKDPEKSNVWRTEQQLNIQQERSNIHESYEKCIISQSANEVFLNDDKKQMNNSFSATLQKKTVDFLLEENLENCKLCGTKFTGPEMARTHYESIKHRKKVMFVKSGKQNCIGECKICNKFFLGLDQQINHFKSIKHLIKAGIITDIEEYQQSESQMKLNIRNAKRCRLCDKFFISTDQAVKHFYSIQHKKKVIMSRTKERRDQHAVNSTDKRLVEVSQELIVNYLASTCDPASQLILENEPSFSCKDVVTLLEKAVEYQVIKEFKCDICKKYFNGLNHSKIHLSKVQHICRLEEAKTLFTDGSFALYQPNIQEENTNHIVTNIEAIPQHNIPETTSQILSSGEILQQPTPLIPMPVDEESCERQNIYNRNEMRHDIRSILSHPSTITEGLLKQITPGALTETSLLTNDVTNQGRYVNQDNTDDLLMKESHINENLLQILAANLIQSQDSAVQGIVSNRSLYNHAFPRELASFHEDWPNSNSQSCFPSAQTFEKDNQYQNERDRSSETAINWYHERRSKLAETERDYQSHNRTARSPDKEKDYRFQIKKDKERRHTRWEKQLDNNSSRKIKSTKWDDLNSDLSRERRKNHSDNCGEKQFNSNTKRSYSRWN